MTFGVRRLGAAWKSCDKTIANWIRFDFDDSAWSKAAVIGAMGDQPWGKQEAKDIDVLGCPLLRKEFQVQRPIRRANVYASALGNFILHVNGRRVLSVRPEWTPPSHRTTYQVCVRRGWKLLDAEIYRAPLKSDCL